MQLPSYKMFWEESPDVQRCLVKNTMSINQFVAILQASTFVITQLLIQPTNVGK